MAETNQKWVVYGWSKKIGWPNSAAMAVPSWQAGLPTSEGELDMLVQPGIAMVLQIMPSSDHHWESIIFEVQQVWIIPCALRWTMINLKVLMDMLGKLDFSLMAIRMALLLDGNYIVETGSLRLGNGWIPASSALFWGNMRMCVHALAHTQRDE